jgi:UDP-N-acetylglucosamine 2-epimerase (non-hydrolysing)
VTELLDVHKPDLVLVHGDTTTAMAAATAAFYKKIPVGHVEAGLRTYNIHSPFPEEFNRQVITKVSKFHFAPTEQSRSNLTNEKVREEDILVSGNTVIDALLECKRLIEGGLKIETPYTPGNRPYILITGHRRENFGEGFLEICNAIKDLAIKYPHYDFVYPVHLNPNVRQPVLSILSGQENIKLTEPQDYQAFIKLMMKSYLILTDSGGVQEEAPSLGKPVLVMRDTTERPEAVTAGTVKLVGASRSKIVESLSRLIDSPEEYEIMKRAHNPYGDGKASERIVEFIKTHL